LYRRDAIAKKHDGISVGRAALIDRLPVNILRPAGVPGGGITRALRGLTIAVIVVPVVLLATAAWVNYVASFRDARERVDRATDAIHQYALKAFESDELILDRLAEHIASKNRSDLIGSAEFHRYLQQFDGRPQISAVGLIKARRQRPRYACRQGGLPSRRARRASDRTALDVLAPPSDATCNPQSQSRVAGI